MTGIFISTVVRTSYVAYFNPLCISIPKLCLYLLISFLHLNISFCTPSRTCRCLERNKKMGLEILLSSLLTFTPIARKNYLSLKFSNQHSVGTCTLWLLRVICPTHFILHRLRAQIIDPIIKDGRKSESTFLSNASRFPKEHCFFESSYASPFVLLVRTTRTRAVQKVSDYIFSRGK
jgi:hypothetical protein